MSKLDDFDAAKESGFEANRLLFGWLSDDRERADLYRCMREHGRHELQFQSRADTKEFATDAGSSKFQQNMHLLAARGRIKEALRSFSNAPYRALGSGTFMLGLDEGKDHSDQHQFAARYLTVDKKIVDALSRVAFLAAAVLPLKQREFDLVNLAEQAALRFAGFLFGFAQADHPLLEETLRAAYRGLNYQIIGRHFVSEPLTLQKASIAMGTLLSRVADLIDLYRVRVGREQRDEFERLERELDELQAWKDGNGELPLRKFEPVLRCVAQHQLQPAYSGNELAVIVVGLIAGTVGNVQAAVSIVISEFLRDPELFQRAHDAAIAAMKSDSGDASAADELQALIWEALRLNPPAAFLPRKTKDGIVLLAMGAATRDTKRPDKFDDKREHEEKRKYDPLIFGGDFLHRCVGQHLSMPLILHIVRQVLLLPGLTESLDPLTAEPVGLTKLWGIMCRTYPLEYKHSELLTQSPLMVVMRVKTPLSEHAELLKKVIRYGAPLIEKKLRDAGHVHFAQFLFIEGDSKLVLFTIYDRDFDSYIEHFALQIGPLFDRLFEHIEDAPPLPVNKYPKEFVDTIRRYNARPVGDYFFSAYPRADVSMIAHQFNRENT